ncbi:MAG: hypothetical protein HZC43_00545 [Nitrosomonadales bacterium]|nr:hypothetical protein [Nitrosomonadales bacterium]
MNIILELPLQAKIVAGLLALFFLWFPGRHVIYGHWESKPRFTKAMGIA